SSGDARVALDTLGFIVDNLKLPGRITTDLVAEAMQRKIGFYNTKDDRYDLLSALQKSIRGSDPDAAIHYYARLIDGGADIQMIGRRLLVIASEDIGMAYPSAVSIVTSCVQAAMMVGLPEAALNLAEAVILLASSPKSNRAVQAYWEAAQDIASREIGPVPDHLRDSHYSGAEKLGYGQSYIYPHDHSGYVKQQYLPDDLERERARYYRPTENGAEAGFKKFLEDLEKRYGNHQG
ncbi:MAG: replication-associated recombination protein A, partial [Clostridia bacterium]|nr:replication-associated recombination protein A [Clostridia bacterium]